MTTTRHPQRPGASQGNTRQARPQRGHPDQPAAQPQQPAMAMVPVKRIFSAENGNYFLLMGVTLFLVVFGLVMVLSSSTIESYNDDDGFFGRFSRQVTFAAVGVPIMLLASRVPASFWRRWAKAGLVFGAVLQLLVFSPLGYEVGGNRNWIRIGESFSAQPSEFVKVALIVWLAWFLSTRQDRLNEWRQVLLPIGLVAGIAIAFVLAGGDLGTAAVMLLIVFGCIFFGSVPLRLVLASAAFIAVVGFLFSKANSSRTNRIDVWLNGCAADDYSGYCWQPSHAVWALADGGLFGKGLGNSVAKWNWLPEASSDYIFAIIGEELGLIGAIVVLLLFIVLAIAFVRIFRASHDSFTRVATAGVMVWVIGQAFVNIGVVLGVLPVLGVPLPLISAGGSALIATLLAIGIVLSFARATPQDRAVPVEQTPADRSRMLASQRVRSRA